MLRAGLLFALLATAGCGGAAARRAAEGRANLHALTAEPRDGPHGIVIQRGHAALTTAGPLLTRTDEPASVFEPFTLLERDGDRVKGLFTHGGSGVATVLWIEARDLADMVVREVTLWPTPERAARGGIGVRISPGYLPASMGPPLAGRRAIAAGVHGGLQFTGSIPADAVGHFSRLEHYPPVDDAIGYLPEGGAFHEEPGGRVLARCGNLGFCFVAQEGEPVNGWARVRYTELHVEVRGWVRDDGEHLVRSTGIGYGAGGRTERKPEVKLPPGTCLLDSPRGIPVGIILRDALERPIVRTPEGSYIELWLAWGAARLWLAPAPGGGWRSCRELAAER